MKIATAKEMQSIDRRAREEYCIPALLLMENAGREVVSEAEKQYGKLKDKRIAIFCGKGNNGGDGAVVARHLHNRGSIVTIYLLAPIKETTEETNKNLQVAIKSAIPLITIGTKRDLQKIEADLRSCDIIVDAILGTGLSSPIKGLYADAIEIINSAEKPVISIDIPSGISSDTGKVLGTAVKADLTVTFALPKRGHILFPGADYCGTVRVADIGFPSNLLEEEGKKIKVSTVEEIEVRAYLKPRQADSHKGTFGHLLVIAGSVGFTGAAAMAGISALRVGAGLVTLAIPESLDLIFETMLPEAITLPLPETEEQTISLAAEKLLIKKAERATAVAVGPGLSTNPETAQLVRNLIERLDVPLVVDADGLNAFVGHLNLLKGRRNPTVLTPHPGEMGRLLGISGKEVQEDRIGIAGDFSKKYGVYLVLKGAHTIIAEPGGEVYICLTGNPGMATAGTGDVLTGMLGGLIAQGLGFLHAIKAGVYLHGLAGDLAAADKGEISTIAGDIIKRIPDAIIHVISFK